MSEPYISDPVRKAMREQLKANIVAAARKDPTLTFVELGQRFGVVRATARTVIRKGAPDVFEKMRRA